MLHRKIEDNTSKRRFFFFRSQTPTSWASSNLLQMPNNCRMVGVEFFVNFACSCKRIGFDEPLNWALSTSRDSEGQGSQAWCSPRGCKRVRHDWATEQQLLTAGHYAPRLQGSRLLCKTSGTTTALCAQEGSWAKCAVDVELSLLLYDPFWTRTRKSL